MAATNYIEGENPFHLSAPPDWWLQRLYDFDHMLVLFPSKRSRQYVLARRRLHSVGLGDVAMLDNKHPDTNFCYRHGLLPVNMPLRVKGLNPWTENSIADVTNALKRRDTWAYTGGAGARDGKEYAAADAVAEAELVEQRKQKADLRDGFYHRGRDAWRSMMARIGSRNKRASDYHGVARPANSGTVQ